MKISKITIKDFRAFAHEVTFDLQGGKNLLLYGENGSGKSSLFHALREFFGAGPRLRAPTARDFRNVFRDGAGGSPTAVDGKVCIYLSDTTQHSWDHGDKGARPIGPLLADARLRSSFLEYRSLIKTNYYSMSPGETLFRLAVEDLFANVRTPAGERIGDLWYKLEARKHNHLTKRAKDEIGDLLKEFNTALSGILPTIEKHVSTYLSKFEETGLAVTIRMPPVKHIGDGPRAGRHYMNQYIGPYSALALDVGVQLNGVTIPDWNEFLNEARLSALAISMYLAGVKESNAVTKDDVLRVLVLDDVLIGLDLDHRLPILKLLDDQFSDYQIFLLTHDKAWYELAELMVSKSTSWLRYELHRASEPAGGWDVPVAHRIGDDKAGYFIQRANHHCDPAHQDLRAAALYARVAFEVQLKKFCSKAKVPVRFELEARHLKTDDFLGAIEAHIAWQGGREEHRFLIERVKLFRQNVLNPLSHFHPLTLAVDEVREAIRAVESLKFNSDRIDYLAEAASILAVTSPKAGNLMDAACFLRTAFETDLHDLLGRKHAKITYRKDLRTKAPSVADLWSALIAELHPTTAPPPGSVAAELQAHARIFLNEWTYAHVSTLSVAELQAALTALRDAATPPTSAAPAPLSRTKLAAHL